MDKENMTAKEVAQHFGISIMAVTRYRREGMPYHRGEQELIIRRSRSRFDRLGKNIIRTNREVYLYDLTSITKWMIDHKYFD